MCISENMNKWLYALKFTERYFSNLLTPGFDPWTVQPIASPYTDWDILAHNLNYRSKKVIFIIYCIKLLVRYAQDFQKVRK